MRVVERNIVAGMFRRILLAGGGRWVFAGCGWVVGGGWIWCALEEATRSSNNSYDPRASGPFLICKIHPSRSFEPSSLPVGRPLAACTFREPGAGLEGTLYREGDLWEELLHFTK